MKQFLFLTAFIMACFGANAQTPRLVSAFNKIPAENRNHIDIKKINGKWMGLSGETEQQLSVKLNQAGTYLELKDPGTGGGVTTFQLKIFKDNDGREFVASNKSWTDGVLYEGGVNLMYMDGADATLQYWPDFEESLNFKPGESKEGNEDYFTGEYSFCNIPESGNTIEITPGYAGITGGCINEDPKACELKKKLVPRIVLAWSKDHNMFMPQ